MQDIINMYIAEAALMALVCLLIGWRKDYSRILCGIAGLIAGPLAVIILAILPNRRVTEETPASRQTVRTEEPRPVPQPAPPEPDPNQKPIGEIKNGEAFLLDDRPVIMAKNGFAREEDAVNLLTDTDHAVCLIADFRNGPPTPIGFDAEKKYTVLNIPVWSVRTKEFHAEDGVWEFADMSGGTIAFRPYIWADLALRSAKDEAEVMLAEYEKKMYVVAINGVDSWRRINHHAFGYSSMHDRKELILIDNEIYCNEFGPIKLGASHKYLNCFVGWQNEKECRMALDQFEQLPVCKPSEVTWEYLYRNGDVCCFMDPETYEQYEIEIYRMCRLPGEGDESKICKLTIAFDRVIQMNIIA